jgi:hypothetical protein
MISVKTHWTPKIPFLVWSQEIVFL